MILLNSQAQAKQRKVPLYLAFALPFTLQVLGIVGLVGYLSYRSGQQTVQDLTDQLLVKTENQVVQELDYRLSFPHEINQLNIAEVAEKTLALSESYAELQLITDSISDCISFTDASMGYQFVN